MLDVRNAHATLIEAAVGKCAYWQLRPHAGVREWRCWLLLQMGLEARQVQYVGRASSAACATASPDIHSKETLELCRAAFGMADGPGGDGDIEM